jgi:2,3-dihydroxybenzoate decarboxylase
MDRNDIGTYVLSLAQPGIEGISNTEEAIKVAKNVNDWVADEMVGKYPDRLRAFASLPLQDPEVAADELERAVKDLGFVGALINGYSSIDDKDTVRYLDEPEVDPFWAKVEELNVPIYLHPRTHSKTRVYEGYDALLSSSLGFGIDTATHAIRLILSGLFDRHPDLNIILGHLGEGLTFLLPRLEHRLRHFTSDHGPHKLTPMEYLYKNFYLTTSGIFRTQTLISTMSEVGYDRILFSVDSPYESTDEIAQWFDNCPISEPARQQIGRDNAKALFNL